MNGDREWDSLARYDDGCGPKRGDKYDNAGLAAFGAICYATAAPKTTAPGSVRVNRWSKSSFVCTTTIAFVRRSLQSHGRVEYI